MPTLPHAQPPVPTARFNRRLFGVTVIAAALAACGGGGGGDNDGAASPTVVAPPGTAAPLVQGSAEAQAAVQALNANASLLLRKSSALDGGSLFAPVGATSTPLALRNRMVGAAREQALARQTVGCSDLGFSACSGSVTFDYNFDQNATVLPAGSYFSITFNGLSGSSAGSTLSMNGLFRMDFLTALSVDAASFANARFQITLGDLSGTVDGVSFGPDTAAALYEFDAQGVPAVTIDGLRIRGLDGLTVIDADNYVLDGTTLRTAHWSNAGGYVEVDFGGWTVSQGRPTAGSAATITGADGATMAITVQSSSASLVAYRVTVTIGGVSTSYDVQADLTTTPPSWTVQAIG